MILFLVALLGITASASSQSVLLELDEGDDCRSLDGGKGTCMMIRECETIGDFKKNRPLICGFKGREPIVCCPNKLTLKFKPGHKVQEVCTVLEKRCRDGLGLTKNVVGGTESKPKARPYMVLIGYGKTEAERSWECAGSIITARYVLSAAHCLETYFLGSAKWARVGDLDYSSGPDDAKPVDKNIIERIPHPEYKPSENYHDIALFKLDSDIAFNGYVSPICLHTKREIVMAPATVVGWGRTGFAEATSEKLLEANIDVYNDTECKRLMFSSSNPKVPRGHYADGMLCAGVHDGSKDACGGDSGGPLLYREVPKCAESQIGIVSYGKGCGSPGKPGVYTRVSNYIPWIEAVAFEGEITY